MIKVKCGGEPDSRENPLENSCESKLFLKPGHKIPRYKGRKNLNEIARVDKRRRKFVVCR